MATVHQSQIIKTLAFDAQAVDTEPEGVGYVLFSDGSKLNWDGVQLDLLDSSDNVVESFYDALSSNEKWAMANYTFAEDKTVAEIVVYDRNFGPWAHAAYQYQAPDNYIDFPDHADNQNNPHLVTAEQVGAYSKQEVDAKQSAIINLGYTEGYWYGRKNSTAPWPLPADGEKWAGNAKKAFDFEANTIWVWDGTEWTEGDQVPVANGTTIGISESLLDIVDSGFPGKAIYSEQKASWDFYPDKLGIEAIQKAIIAPCDFGYTAMTSEADMAKWRRMPADGRTISVHDSRAERLLQYCLIPHALAVANPNIIGLYRTNEYYPDHAAWLAVAGPNKVRPEPAEDGAYLVIPDGCGIFLRGKGQHGGHRAANAAPYEGGSIGQHLGDAMREIVGEAGWVASNLFSLISGVFKGMLGDSGYEAQTKASVSGTNTKYRSVQFVASRVVPTANEFRVASISISAYISY